MVPTELKQCGFSQRQGNVTVYRNDIADFFASELAGKGYECIAYEGGLIFKSPRSPLRVFLQ